MMKWLPVIAGALIVGQAGALVATSAPAATFIPSVQVAAAFDKGVPLLVSEEYKVHASRREAPGLAEIHTRDTDIIYVLEGAATIVTGGTAVAAKAIAQDEVRGVSITGGDVRRLTKGDVLVVPNGMPHQFTDTSKPFLYYVVKATSPAAGATR
jgi:mannose-6-phosphate isomerase-like protein (cupin superfamily)